MSDGLASRAWRTVIGGASSVVTGAAEWLASVKPGLSTTTTVQSTPDKPLLTTGVSVRATDAVMKLPQAPAIAISSSVASALGAPQVSPGLATSVVEQVTLLSELPAFEIVQVKDDLTHRSGSNSTATSGTGAWSPLANGQGIHDGALASHAGNLTAAHDTYMSFAFADFSNKDALTIVSVRLHFYVRQSGTTLNNGDLRLYRGDASSISVAQLEQITGDINSLTTPRTFDVTANYPTWASLNDLRASARHLTGAGEAAITADIDAVELEIVATMTWGL